MFKFIHNVPGIIPFLCRKPKFRRQPGQVPYPSRCQQPRARSDPHILRLKVKQNIKSAQISLICDIPAWLVVDISGLIRYNPCIK